MEGAGSSRSDRAELPTARWRALGTGVVLRVLDRQALDGARALVAAELDAIDLACSRFRADSELSRANARAGGPPVRVAPLLIEALQVALRGAELSDGAVDPTVGAALVLAGYDRDWRLLEPGRAQRSTAAPALRARVRGGWRTIELDPARATVRVPRGVSLDLGASAKAWAADRAARAVHEAHGAGVLVSVGGDIATAGPAPAGGWRIHVTDDHRDGPDAPGQTVAIASGGLATSSTAVRRWRNGTGAAHHIIDPGTARPAREVWRTVSVAAADCVDANIASTAALVRGASAAAWLAGRGLPARLADREGRVLRIAGWPEDRPACDMRPLAAA
jgi:thiamine biosynthesis lipoprotein